MRCRLNSPLPAEPTTQPFFDELASKPSFTRVLRDLAIQNHPTQNNPDIAKARTLKPWSVCYHITQVEITEEPLQPEP